MIRGSCYQEGRVVVSSNVLPWEYAIDWIEWGLLNRA